MLDVNSLSYDGIVSKELLAVPFIKQLSDTDTQIQKPRKFLITTIKDRYQ